jgi:hypothetical protein
MKFEPRSFPRSARASHRQISRYSDPELVESKCPACGRTGDNRMGQSFARQSIPRGSVTVAAPPVEHAGVSEKRSFDAIDPEKLLHFSQQLYAHALTLQEVIRSGGELAYEVLRPRYDRQAAQQFEIFHHTFEKSSGLNRTAGVGK